jgi:hypothetical protein
MSRFFNWRPGLAQLHKVMRVESFPVACGEFIDISDVEKDELEKPGWALVPEGFRHREGMFAALLRGNSMTPRYNDRKWGLFVLDPGGTRWNRIFPDGTWQHRKITLFPLNHSEDAPIHLDLEDDYQICGWLVGTVRQIQRVEEHTPECVRDEI